MLTIVPQDYITIAYSFLKDRTLGNTRTHEHTINDTIANILRSTRAAWSADDIVRSEYTQLLQGSSGRPDILVQEPTVSPVVIETEVMPAQSVEEDARSRLGKVVKDSHKTILSTIAVRLPKRLRKLAGSKLDSELRNCDDLEIAILTGTSGESTTRWPASGWIEGSIADLSIITQSASVPPAVVEEAADYLVEGVSKAAAILTDVAQRHAGALERIGEELRQEDDSQTRRMAAAILANAFVFHENLAGGPGELAKVQSLEELRGQPKGLRKSVVLSEWRKILAVNYWPIFDIAKRILEAIPTSASKKIIDVMEVTAERLLENNLMRSHDLTGRLFQQLIADRKFLAAYYTTPAAASLLVGLAITDVQTLSGDDWKDTETVSKLRIADFACGTGTLLSTAYQRVGQLHELAGGNAESLHQTMMAHSLIGCDILPAAAHLTASMLAGSHPTVKYDQSRVMTIAYGLQKHGAVSVGALDLLERYRSFRTLDITAKTAAGTGEAQVDTSASVPHLSCNVVLMNPPFTRATGHEAKKVGVPVPMFAAFHTSKSVQRKMSDVVKKMTRDSAAHGNAGEASIFLVLGNRKLKRGGVLGLVMPVSLVTGYAWKGSRNLLATNYNNLIVVSISGKSGPVLSFSADTDIGECIIVAEKTDFNMKANRATFAVLDTRPESQMAGMAVATQIRRSIASGQMRQIEDGPVGGTPLRFGDEIVGHAIQAPVNRGGSWNIARISDLSLAQSAFQLMANSRIWLPTMQSANAVSVPITTVSGIGTIGPYHMDINGAGAKGAIRGPFEKQEPQDHTVPTYPLLWSHDADNQRTMMFEADSEAVLLKSRSKRIRDLIDVKAAAIWASASYCHFNENFRFNSQSTSMQFTDKRTIGGRAWTSIQMNTKKLEKALVVWSNTTLGLLVHWFHANKQQAGRGSIGVLPLQHLPILDVTKLSKQRLASAVAIFDEMSSQELGRFSEIDTDATRATLDEKFGRKVLGLSKGVLTPGGPMDLVRQKLAQEPSIHG